MSWLDQFFTGIGQAPITVTAGPAPRIGITPATTTAAGSMSAADKAKLDNLPGAYSGSGVTTDNTTSTPVVSFPVPTGYACWATLTMTGQITTGGDAGKWIAWQELLFFHNVSGTPALSTGTPSASPPATVGWDETSGALDLSALQTPSYSAGLVTLNVKGVAATSVAWKATVQPLYFAN